MDDAYDFNWEAEIDNVLASVWNFMGTKRKKAKLVLNNTDIIKNIVMNEENIKSSAELPANFFAPAK